MRTIAGTSWSVEDAREYIKARVRLGENGCWVWARSCDRWGYGRANVPQRHALSGPRFRQPHRLSRDAFTGPIPDGLLVLHRCDNPPCCNPEHLFVGTQADNAADMFSKGRGGGFIGARGEAHARSMLTDERVREARRLMAEGVSQTEVARRIGVSRQIINHIHTGRRWAHLK